MAFFTTTGLRETARRKGYGPGSAQVHLTEAVRKSVDSTFDFFLCHSFRDAEVVLGLQEDIEEMGFSVYVDWIGDPQLDRTQVTRATAKVLRERMNRCQALLWASTPHAGASLWMPWEAGYFDGHSGRVAILPVFETDPPLGDRFRGQEYLGLYPYVVRAKIQGRPTVTLWVHNDERTYTDAANWLQGQDPTSH